MRWQVHGKLWKLEELKSEKQEIIFFIVVNMKYKNLLHIISRSPFTSLWENIYEELASYTSVKLVVPVQMSYRNIKPSSIHTGVNSNLPQHY